MDAPTRPDEADCCNSGCNPCILDVYEEQLRKYKARKVTGNVTYKNCISETSYSVFQLIDKIQHTNDTFLLIFKYCRAYRNNPGDVETEMSLLYKPGQHFLLRSRYKKGDNHYTRAYTPIPFSDLPLLSFCVLVKIYEDGMMSRYLKQLDTQSETLWRGPYCDFKVSYEYRNIFMIAQGTGIAPLYTIIEDILRNEECETLIKLYFCCRSCDEILLHEQLYKCASYWNFSYEIFVSISDNFKAKYNEIIHRRRLEKGEIVSYLSDKIDKSTQVLICGSEIFNKCISGYLDNLDELNVFIF